MTWMRAYDTDAEAGTDQHPGRDAVLGTEVVGVFLGLDVGTSTHHGHGLTPAGKKVFDEQPPNSEPKLRAVFDKPAAKFGTVLVIADQPASIGALPPTVARDAGCMVVYLPGLAMRRIADVYPGEAKTDARDAAVIADAARTMPHTLRSLELTDEITAELTVLVGSDQDLATEATRTSNRIRGLLTRFPPASNASSGPASTTRPSPGSWSATGPRPPCAKPARRLVELIRPKAPRMAQRLIDDVFDALDEQTVVVPSTCTLEIVVPLLRQATRPRQDPHASPPPPRPSAHQRPVRHAPRRHPLRTPCPRHSRRMTLGITCGRGGKPTPSKDTPHEFAARYRSP
ncbi:transposase [Streptomyces zinciresistens K42]|uniref:Transposase n=1 Tax=Streptomyces zinciresistens K42 TaxID=700597 RepID=G2G4J8_9ACTN|nr:transposase [Streptomyces zinciresistens K42]